MIIRQQKDLFAVEYTNRS